MLTTTVPTQTVPTQTVPTTNEHSTTEPAFRLRTSSVARSRGDLRILDVRDDLSRVTRANGEIVGYVDRVDVAGGTAYRARRYVATERRFVEFPDVWSADDAVDCLRWG